MARELLQLDEPGAVLSLMGRSVAELADAHAGLLLIGGESPLCVSFERDGSAHMAPADHPWYAAAQARMCGDAGTPCPPGARILAIPQGQPMAVLLADLPAHASEASTRQQNAALEAALELTAATLGRIHVRSTLERTVTSQYAQIADIAQEHADELARRDMAARKMLALSLTDVLTGLNNRRGFFARAEPLYHLAQRQLRGSAVIYADIDGLKAVNDALGHASGDQMIRDAAMILSASLREADVLARLGGDEFVAYALDEAQPIALLSRLEHKLVAFNGLQKRPYQLAVSVGMVSCDPLGQASLSDLIQQADRAMYAQKKRRQPH